MKNTRVKKIEELVSICKKVDESDLKYIIGCASGIAMKSGGVKSNG